MIGAARFDDRLAIMQMTELIVKIDKAPFGQEEDLPTAVQALITIQGMIKPVTEDETTGTFLTHDTYFSLVTVLMALFERLVNDKYAVGELFWAYVDTTTLIFLLYQNTGESESLIKYLS